MKQYEYNVMAQAAEHSFKRPYTKASMQVIEIESEGFFTQSGPIGDPTMHGNGGQSFKNLHYERHGANSDIFAD